MNGRQRKNLIRILLTFSLLLLSLVIFEFFKVELFTNKKLTEILHFSILVAIYLIIAYDVLINAVKGVFSGEFLDENFLMTIASVGAFIIGEWNEAVSVMLFYQVGELFQSYAVGKSRKSISDILDIRPEYANLVNNRVIDRVLPEKVNVGDIILINPGERVPLDGVVISGESYVDEKAITGEAQPRFLSVGEKVYSGSILTNGSVEVRVEKTHKESTVSQILELVENATSKKSKSEKFISKFAKIYTPIVVGCAFIIAIIPSIITKDWSRWVYVSLNFLVVSCPCAVVVSVPMAFFSAVGKCSKIGVFVKGSAYIEKLANADIFVFDKTGTLTKGNFKVTEVYPIENSDEILRLASLCEQYSSHPIAKSIVDFYGKEILEKVTITEFSGMGVLAKGEDEILCGNAKLMEKFSVRLPCEIKDETVVYVAKNGEFKGYIIVSDQIKEESLNFIDSLKNSGVKTVMLTGDRKFVAEKVANKLGINEVYSQLLPQNKVEKLEEIFQNKDKNQDVCFIGDGLNDAPSLMRADVGISMGLIASDATIEASDMVVLKDDLLSILETKKISKKTINIAKQNIVFALTVKVLIMVLSLLGIGNLWLAVFGDVGVALIAILNSLRLF